MTAGAGRLAHVDALRALAIVLVLGFHFRPVEVPRGLLGVDVFFVISGFVIARLLLREADATGTISLRSFWERRARRILPAALTALTCATVLTLAALPSLRNRAFGEHVVASLVFVENWLLARSPEGTGGAGTPLAHLWSLGVEEQFYLVFPLLVLGLILAVTRGRPGARRLRPALAVTASAVIAASYARMTMAPTEQWAYFGTDARAWQIACGVVLACLPALRLGQRLRSVLQGAGVAVIVACAVWLPALPMPGWGSILPVVATSAVIAAGESAPATWAGALTRAPVVAWFADRSYSLYLFHFPVVVVARSIEAPGWTNRLLVVVPVSLALAEASRRWVERPWLGKGRRG